MQADDPEVVKSIWIVNENNNVTVYDTFSEETHTGPLNVTQRSWGFITKEAATAFNHKGNRALMYAGAPGMSFTYPQERKITGQYLTVLECKSEGEEYYHILCPAKRVICHGCDGDGTELRGGLKGAAFSQEEMDEDPDFRESYFGGDFDVACSVCNGEKIILEHEEKGLPDNIMADFERADRERREHEAEVAAHARNLERGIHT